MGDLSTQRRLAASLMGVGRSRIYVSPDHVDDVEEAITRDDVRSLINMGYIDVRPVSTPSRGRKRAVKAKKAKGKRKGHGSRKGAKAVRRDPEDAWIHRVRKQRAYIRSAYRGGEIDHAAYRRLYMSIKGGVFPSLSSLKHAVKGKV